MGGRRSIVEFDRFFGGGECTEVSLVRRHGGKFAQKVIAIGHSNVSVGIVGIAGQSLCERIQGLIEAFGSPLVPVKPSFEVELLSLPVRGRMLSSGQSRALLGSGFRAANTEVEPPHGDDQN